jgi:hypothetical protein
MTEVVGYLVSEKGRQGVSPSTASNGNARYKTELVCFSQEDFAGETK